MKIITSEEFMARASRAFPLNMNVSIYEGMSFECACGNTHAFSGDPSDILREMKGMQLLIVCPNKLGITCVKVAGMFRPQLKAQFGAKGSPS